MNISLIVNVLDSNELVRRQLIHLERTVSRIPGHEIIIVDDGSSIPIIDTLKEAGYKFTAEYIHREIDGCSLHKLDSYFNVYILETHDTRQWTQVRARQVGIDLSKGERIFLFDIDHILTEAALKGILYADYDRMHFPRIFVSIDKAGYIDRNTEHLRMHGCTDDEICNGRHPGPNIFAIHRRILSKIGYNVDKYAGRYGHEDTDINRQYARKVKEKVFRPSIAGEDIGVIKGPCAELGILMHSLIRNVENTRD